MDDLISRQQAIALKFTKAINEDGVIYVPLREYLSGIQSLPPVQPEPCRECKWSKCYINMDKYGKSETYWRCINWGAETDEDGYCHEWKRKTDG